MQGLTVPATQETKSEDPSPVLVQGHGGKHIESQSQREEERERGEMKEKEEEEEVEEKESETMRREIA